jgi:hypothetical protein
LLRNNATIRAVFSLVAVLPGCAIFGGSPDPWVDSPWYSGPEEILWDATLSVLDRDFEVGASNPATGTFETLWRESLSPFRGEGKRRMVEGVMEKKGANRRVRLQVYVEVNMELDSPTDSSKAKWRKRQEDPIQARVLLRHLHNILLESGFRVVTSTS